MIGMKILVFFMVCLYLTNATSEDVGESSKIGIETDGKVHLAIGNNKSLEYNSKDKSLTTVAEGVSVSSDELLTNLKDKLPVERNAQPSVVARKGVKSSITARKGAESTPTPLDTEIPLTIQSNEIKNTSEATPLNIDLLKGVKANDTKDISTTETTKFDKKIKLKPTVTIAGVGGDDTKPSIGIVPTRIPPLESSSKINYVVSVIITMLVLPLFVIFVIFIYRNGRECWEKRHYRRMDFLIDGMYNE